MKLMKLFRCVQNDSWRLQLYELLAVPAHLWLWACARLCGGHFECGPVSDPADPLDA